MISTFVVIGCYKHNDIYEMSLVKTKVVAEVIAFEDEGFIKYDFNNEPWYEAATLLKVLSPREFEGVLVRYFHSNEVDKESLWRAMGVSITYERPYSVIPMDMGIVYGDICPEMYLGSE